jgi:hypothetical protein
MMDDRYSYNDQTRDRVGPRSYVGSWGIPALIAAVVLIAGVLVFGAAGPDRTRTAEYNNLSSKPVSTGLSTTGDARGPAAKIPNTDMPTAPRTP